MYNSVVATDSAIEATGLVHRVAIPAEGAGDRLLILVHGRAGSADVPWTFTRALTPGRWTVVAVQAPIADQIGGWSWWRVDETATNRVTTENDLLPAIEKLKTFREKFLSEYRLQPSVVVGLGFSQGAAVLSSLTLKYPPLFNGAALLAGFIPKYIYPEGQFIPEFHPPAGSKLPRYFIAHGSADSVVPIDRAEKARDSLAALGADVRFHSEEVGHKLGAQGMRGLATWFSTFEVGA